MQLFFCEKCGRRVSDVEVARGDGRLIDGLAWCKACVEFAPPEGPGTPSAAPRRPPSHARRPATAAGTARSGGFVPLVAIGGGLLAGLVAGLVIFLSRKPDGPGPVPPPAAAPAAGEIRTGPPAPPEHRPAPLSESRPELPALAEEVLAGPAPVAAPAAGPVRERLFVAISAPVQGALFKPGSDIRIDALVMGGDGNVSSLEFLADGRKLGDAAGGGRSFTWTSVPEGSYALVARAADGSGETVESAAVRVNVAPSKAVAGCFVEAESGAHSMSVKQSDQASGGSLVQGNSTGNELTVDLQVAEAVPGAEVVIRNVGWGSQNGQLEVSFGPSAGALDRFGRIDCRGGMKWKRVSTGRDLQPGSYRVRLRVPSERAGGAFDIVGIVPAGTGLPNRLAGGVLEENGLIVSAGSSLNMGPAGGGAAGGGGAGPAAHAPRPSDEQSVFAGLVKTYDAAKVTAKRLAAIGGPVAASTHFEKSLMAELTKADGYDFSPKLGLAGSSGTAASLKQGVERRLDKERPEVVRVCFDVRELAARRRLEEKEADLRFIVEKILEHGAVPVLYTLPVARTGDETTDDLVAGYNVMVGDLANSLRVPHIDAYGLLNADEARIAEYCTLSGLKPEGYELLNAKFLDLYRKLEEKVLARAKPAAGKPGGEAGEPSPAPGAGPSANSLVLNGGFEEMADRLAKGWERWSTPRAQWSLRFDRANVRSGERAAEVRVLVKGGSAGLQQRLRLEPGTYEVRFWACADAGTTASARCSLEDDDGPDVTVTDAWTQFRRTVEVGQRNPSAGLRIWTATDGIRVWFDDVEVVPARK